MILTEEFLKSQNACAEGLQIAFDNNYLGQDYSSVIRNLISIERKDFAGWMLEQKNTEAYVRYNGKEVTMTETYQVFNPIDGTYTECQNESEAKAKIIEVTKVMLDLHKISVCRALKNENGDVAWIPVEIEAPYTFTPTP